MLPKAATYNNYDATPTSDALPKSTTYNDYNSTPTPVTATATVASVGAAAAAAATGAAAARGGVKAPTTPEDLPVSRSSKVADPEAVPMIESTRPSWDANSQGGASTHSSVRTPSRPAGTNLTPVKTSVAGSDMSHVSGPTGTAASADTTSAAGSAASGWRTNVRPASGQLPATAGATNSMANTAGKGSQQAERAKFWAQFQETWQQVGADVKPSSVLQASQVPPCVCKLQEPWNGCRHVMLLLVQHLPRTAPAVLCSGYYTQCL